MVPGRACPPSLFCAELVSEFDCDLHPAIMKAINNETYSQWIRLRAIRFSSSIKIRDALHLIWNPSLIFVTDEAVSKKLTSSSKQFKEPAEVYCIRRAGDALNLAFFSRRSQYRRGANIRQTKAGLTQRKAD